MVYDADRNEVVLFGGIENTSQVLEQVLGDTWVWDGVNWIQKSPPNSPSPRFDHVMAYDAARHEVVLFGGLLANGALNGETWVWNGTTWTEVFPATSPPPRDLAAMAYDSVRNETVLFGGRGLSGGGVVSPLDETWLWDGVNWMQAFPAMHPSARLEHAMTFDTLHTEVLLFGGRLAPFPSDFDDTWAWDGVDWTERFPATSPPPTGGHALSYSAIRDEVISFGGLDNGAFSRNDTWSWNGMEWAQIIPATSPPARFNHAMVYDSTLREIVLFGGWVPVPGNLVAFNDTWVFEDPQDTTPPVITTSVSPSILWPPNGRMVPVTISGTITDTGSGVDPSSATFHVKDEYGIVHPSGPVEVNDDGSYRVQVLLASSRHGSDLDGRTYTVTVNATDKAGNLGSAETIIRVPHDRHSVEDR